MSLKKTIIILLSVVALSMPLIAFANNEDDHQHQRALQKVITDDSNAEIPYCGEFYCNDCQTTYYDTISFEDLGMPIINICGSLDGVSKTNKVTASIQYMSDDLTFETDTTFKIQGSSSAVYPKKNYSIQFVTNKGKKNKIQLVDSWGAQSKYCLKANYVDYSQSRNIVSGRLFNDIVHSRGIDDEIGALSNGGVVDGYPVAVFYNEQYLGLYTMNIPKDKWMFGMNDETLRQALLFGETWSNSVKLKEQITDVNDVTGSGWDLEYCSTEDDETVGVSWVAESMNAFIGFLNDNDGDAFKDGVSQYTDVDRAIDVLIFTYFIHAGDNVSKNIMWATYDGVHWIPSVYDMDGTWGMEWNGVFDISANDFSPGAGNMLFRRLLDNYPDEIQERYVELRETILSKSNIQRQFALFFSNIPQVMYSAESEKWTDVPSQDTNNYDQIISFMQDRVDYYDGLFGATIQEQEDLAYRVSFHAPTGTNIFVYETQDYSVDPVASNLAFSRTKNGALTQTDGQVNFLVAPSKGYVVDNISVTPSDGYKNLKGKEETGQDNTYRITKISKDIDVTIKLKKHVEHNASGNASYDWADDYLSCTASDICTDCGADIIETVNSVYSVEKEANCSEKGIGKYIAEFDNNGFTTQTHEVDIEPSGHNWGEPAYYWNDDCSKAAAIRICLNNITHVQAETVNTTAVVKQEATCENKGTTTYTAVFNDDSFVEQSKDVDDIPARGHTWKHYEDAAGLLKNGTEYDLCEVCGVKGNEKTLYGYANNYVKSLKITKGKKAFTVKWKKQSKANQKKFNGYQIRYSTNSDMSGAKKAAAGKASKSKKIGKLAKKTKYYVQVRTYTKSGGVVYYSKWSEIKSVITK